MRFMVCTRASENDDWKMEGPTSLKETHPIIQLLNMNGGVVRTVQVTHKSGTQVKYTKVQG